MVTDYNKNQKRGGRQTATKTQPTTLMCGGLNLYAGGGNLELEQRFAGG